MYITKTLTQFTLPHEVRFGPREFTVYPGWNDFDHTVHPEDEIFAKLPHEYDWYNYGKVKEFVHEMDGELQLWLFHKNNDPSRYEMKEEPQSRAKTKKKSNWW